MCNNHHLFTNLRNLKGLHHNITGPDGRKVKVTCIGDIQLTKHIMWYNVLYVPTFQFSHIFVSKLSFDLNALITFLLLSALFRAI